VKDSAKTALDMIFYVVRMLLLGALLLLILFVAFFCMWFGTNPVTFIGAFFFDTGAMDQQHLVKDVKPALQIGEVWQEESLFEVQMQSAEEITLEQFDKDNIIPDTKSLSDMRAFQVTFSIANFGYSETKTTAYGTVKGLYAIVHAYSRDSGPLQSNHDSVFGIGESDGNETTGIEEGQVLQDCQQSFLVPKGTQDIYIVVEIPSENDAEKMYRQEYQYVIPSD